MTFTKYEPVNIQDNGSSKIIIDNNIDNKNNLRRLSRYLTLKNFLFCLMFWSILFLIYFYKQYSTNVIILASNIFGNIIFNNTNNDIIENTFNNSNDSCSPIIKSYKQYFVSFNDNDPPYPRIPLSLHQNKSLDFECLNRSKTNKLILFWTPFFGHAGFGYGLGLSKPFANNNCPVTNCELTNNRSRLDSSSLVMVHFRDHVDPMPTRRPANQRWIFVLYESPMHSQISSAYNGLFNMTSTYKRESDFADFYQSESGMSWQQPAGGGETVVVDYMAAKISFAAILVSNCDSSNNRLEYVRQLQRYVSVDIFGRCGKPCPVQFRNGTKHDNCKSIVGIEYKFYLAFENSNCDDYITEKFFTVIRYNIIPVVMGRGAYDHYIPKSAYINVNDFKDAKALADYLLHLDKDKESYNAYFEWKKHVTFQEAWQMVRFSPICDMCIRLNLEEYFDLGNKSRVIEDLSGYWSKQKNCS